MSYLSGGIAYVNPTGIFGPRTPIATRSPAETYFNVTAGSLTPPRPVTTAPVAIPIPTTLPVSIAPRPPAPSTIVNGSKPPVPSIFNVFGGAGGQSAGGGGASVGPSGATTPDGGASEAGMFGFQDTSKIGLVFLALAGLVVFMESKKGHR